MTRKSNLPIVLLMFAAAASAPGLAWAQAPAEPGGEVVKVRRGPFRAVFEAEGVFIPVQASEISLSPLAYEGELRVEEVIPHGSEVRQGDIVLRLADEKIREMGHGAGWSLRTAERTLADTRARREDFESDAERDIARAERDLALAEKNLKGYQEVARALEKDEQSLGERSYKHSIEDQEDEIAQLGKMYKEDQLTEETEEIVLKRAKRNLDETKNRLTLFQRRHFYGEEYTEPVQRETLENGVKDKKKALRDLRRGRESARVLGQVELDKLEHELGTAQKRLERLRRDLEVFTVKAPHDGVVVHGGFEDKVAVNVLRRNATVPLHQTILTIARPGQLQVRINLKEKDRYRLQAGLGAAILPEALPDRRFTGSLLPIRGFPLPDNTWNAHVIFGQEDPRLAPLLKCKVAVTLHDGLDSITVPIAAVFRKGDRTITYVRGKSPFGIVARTIVTGADDGKSIVVREGLSEGDEVLLQEPPQ